MRGKQRPGVDWVAEAATYAGRATGRGLTGWRSRPLPTAKMACDSYVNIGMVIYVWLSLSLYVYKNWLQIGSGSTR